MQASSRLFATALAALALGLAGRAMAQTQLAKENPFGPVGSAGAAVAAASETIEFSGVVMGNKTLVILYDKIAKKGRLIPVGETVDGITVIGYDSHREQVSVKIGTEQKMLQLRKSTGVANAGTPAPGGPNPAMNFNVPTPQPVVADFGQKSPTAANDSAAAPLTAPKPEGPVTPPTIAKQEEEARMLVSDLLEIGMAQRKEYEEKQKRAAAGEQNAASTPPPTPAQPAKGS